jgi:YD repeat-containing protein
MTPQVQGEGMSFHMTRRPNHYVAVVAALLGCTLAPPMLAGQGRRGSANNCRTGLATYRVVTVSPGGLTSTIDGKCTFDPAAAESTCTNLYSDTTGRRFTSVAVTRHASRGDVVDEVSTNPPLNLALGTTTTVSGAGMNTVSTSALSYDGRRRLTGITAVAQSGAQTSTTAYTAWDAAGRPTAATITGGRQASSQAISYNDASRTQSMTSGGITCTQTFDEDGNPAVGRCAGSTTTTTVLTTQQICR